MNKQFKSATSRGIEWTDYTWNPIAGCLHGCAWTMPDGAVANCYAEDVADRVAPKAYPNGFEYHYFRPELLAEPLKLKRPARIFCGSMADVFGHWVPDEQIQRVLNVCRQASQHQFQFLTKNAPALLRFDFPDNVWVGASVPPTYMFGQEMTAKQQVAMLRRTLDILDQVKAPVRWMSLEPLSWDMAWLLHGHHLQWAVIGAASNGPKTYQPEVMWVIDAIEALDRMAAKVFFKGNLKWDNYGGYPWREEFPTVRVSA